MITRRKLLMGAVGIAVAAPVVAVAASSPRWHIRATPVAPYVPKGLTLSELPPQKPFATYKTVPLYTDYIRHIRIHNNGPRPAVAQLTYDVFPQRTALIDCRLDGYMFLDWYGNLAREDYEDMSFYTNGADIQVTAE